MTQILCADIGNYSTLIAAVDGRNSSEIVRMRSIIYDATHNGECRHGVHTPESPMVAYGDRHYKIGHQAKAFPGFLSAAEAGKAREDIFLPLLLSATPSGFEGTVKVLVPARDDLKENLLSKSVLGTHSYTVFKGGKTVEAIASFTEVEFHRETDAAARFAFDSGAISPDDVVLTVDIGGGTCNYLIADYQEDAFSIRLRKSLENAGGIALAQALANTDLLQSYGRALEIAKIMDAITEGKRHIANRRDLTFEPVWEDAVSQWFDGMVSRIMASCDRYLDEVTSIVWCGGGAEILRHKLNQTGHIILEDPQLANIKGLMQASKLPHLRMVA